MDKQTHRPSTVTLAAHVHRGLIRYKDTSDGRAGSQLSKHTRLWHRSHFCVLAGSYGYVYCGSTVFSHFPALNLVCTTFYLYILGPSWLKNLYFSYLLVLRAITKMEVHWIHYQFYTGNVTEDASVKEKIIKIVQAAK